MREYDRGFLEGYKAGLANALGPDAVEVLDISSAPMPKKRKPRKKDPKMARALEEANRKGRTSKGSLRKGWNQARIMRTAHKIKKGL